MIARANKHYLKYQAELKCLGLDLPVQEIASIHFEVAFVIYFSSRSVHFSCADSILLERLVEKNKLTTLNWYFKTATTVESMRLVCCSYVPMLSSPFSHRFYLYSLFNHITSLCSFFKALL